MAYTPLQLGSPTSSKEAISRSLVKVDTMLNELYNTNPSAIDWTNFSNTILPSADSTYDLGSASRKWRSLYVSSNTIYIGTSALSITAQGNIQVDGNTFNPVVSYNDLTNKPTFATVATSGSYADLSNKPALFSGAYADLSGKPTLFSGSYTDLTNQPSLFNGSYNSLTDRPALFSGSYADLSNKPALFSGAYADLSGKPTLFSGSYTDLTNQPTIPSITGLATESYVTNAIGNLVSTAPTALNTLSELATALGNDSNFSGTVTASLGNRLRVDINTQNLTSLQKSNATTNLGLATVATTGIYFDLVNKPTIPTNLDSLTDVAISGATTGQVLKYNGTTWVNDVDLSGGGGGGSLPSRTVTTAVTSTIANGASENITVTGFKGYIIYKLQTSAAAWVRAYTSIAERTADQSRTITTDPTPGSGVVAEIITTGAQTVNMAPATIGFSNENTPDVNIPIRVTNRSGFPAAITVTMTLIQIEV